MFVLLLWGGTCWFTFFTISFFLEAVVQFTAFLGGLTCQLDVIDSNRRAVAVNVKFLRVGHEITPKGISERRAINTVLVYMLQRNWLIGSMFLSHSSKNIVYIFVVNRLFHLYEKLYNKNSLQSVVGLWGEEVSNGQSSPLIVLLGTLMCWEAFPIFAVYMNIRSSHYW